MTTAEGFLQDAEILLQKGVPWSGLGGDALAFVLASLVEQGPWLVVVDEADKASQLVGALQFFQCPAHYFPTDDSRPYDGFSPDRRLPAQRLLALHELQFGQVQVVVAPARALLSLIPNQETRSRGTKTLEPGMCLERQQLVEWLTDAGYLATGRVDEQGCFAVRGDVVDIWVGGLPSPTRLDFFDDELETLRPFDPTTQRTLGKSGKILILPAREERLDKTAQSRLQGELSRLVADQDRGVTLRRRVLEDVREGIRFSAIEDYLPALVPTSTPLDELAGLRIIVVSPDDVFATLRDFEEQAHQRWSALEDEERPLVPPQGRYVAAGEVISKLEKGHQVFEFLGEGNLGAEPVDGYAVRGTDLAPVARRLTKLTNRQVRVGLVVGSESRAKTVTDLLANHDIELTGAKSPWEIERGQLALLIGNLSQGFVAGPSGWAFIPVSALFGRRRHHRLKKTHAAFDVSVKQMSQLRESDFIVHRLHGIGIYRGIRRIEVLEGIAHDFVRLEYNGGDLLLPVTRLEQLSLYQPVKARSSVKLDRLGGATWARRTTKVRDSLLGMAQDLLHLFARREVATRGGLEPPGGMYRSFEARFEYDETVDQAGAIEAVQQDLSHDVPMDRLICGDVGFGKTEVAMRAAMRVMENKHQVAVLCPTTVLAYQHLHTFRDRFRDFPVRIGMLSRFNDPAANEKVLVELKDGSLDVVVATTSLLGRRVKFANLGLVVIDEEHRFGVKQKNHLKKMRAEVDILSMSATPIPRTLQMALSGIRDISVMATPPAERLAVRTTVTKLTRTRVRDVILQELDRKGQVFFIHNRVQTIAKQCQQLKRWVPEASIAFAHGQMSSDELERVLVD
ncbi:MAG: DEAD/DEAH box helicase, partial [Proteobacteria bacterium]|nr:DEAD/DEAH box helicase [Pseudomonadota bacterium]